MSIFDFLKTPDPATVEAERLRNISAELRHDEYVAAIKRNRMPASIQRRLHESRYGKVPWIATLTPAELLIVRSHGVRPVATVSASCWLHYGWSWTNGHREGWRAALQRLRDEAKAAGANAVLDVKMRTIPMEAEDSMDFTLIGTAVKIDDLPADQDPIVATVPALEFVKLLDMGIIPTGIAIGAEYQWLTWQGAAYVASAGNIEVDTLSRFLAQVRRESLRQLRADFQGQGNGCLAHIHFSQMFKFEERYLARYIVIATVIQRTNLTPIGDDIRMCVNMGQKPLSNPSRHHRSYETTDTEGAI